MYASEGPTAEKLEIDAKRLRAAGTNSRCFVCLVGWTIEERYLYAIGCMCDRWD